MSWQTVAVLAAIAVPFAATFVPPSRAADKPRVSGPAVHDNLAVYFVHGSSAAGPVPLTLREAMEAGKVEVHETGHVNELTIENLGEEEIFVQAGDIVKGGRQDRVLTVSFLVPAKSGRMPIGAYCVEQGRWSARGREDVAKFASAEKAVPSREAKLAMMAPAKPRATPSAVPAAAPNPTTSTTDPSYVHAQRRQAGGTIDQTATGQTRGYADTSSRQSGVWASVAMAQSRLSASVGDNVASGASATSLQLALENKKLDAARKAYIDSLTASGEAADDIVGYVIAIGGKPVSGDVYPSHGLFRKMWGKQLEAAATEAIAEHKATPAAAPSLDDIGAFIARAEAGKSSVDTVDGATLVREVREGDAAIYLETRRAAGGMVHRAYVAF